MVKVESVGMNSSALDFQADVVIGVLMKVYRYRSALTWDPTHECDDFVRWQEIFRLALVHYATH